MHQEVPRSRRIRPLQVESVRVLPDVMVWSLLTRVPKDLTPAPGIVEKCQTAFTGCVLVEHRQVHQADAHAWDLWTILAQALGRKGDWR